MQTTPHSHSRTPVNPQTYQHIPGWGADLDHKNRPTYPMERTPPRLEGVHWEEPEQQPIKEKVYHSIEREDITPVFGTVAPPRGISGRMRDVAYKLSENDIRHWLLLILADRVDVVEGIGDDLRRGHVPNFLAEMGIKAELKHNPGGLVRKAAIGGAVLGMGYYFWKKRQERRLYG